jgi:hypothetical protein
MVSQITVWHKPQCGIRKITLLVSAVNSTNSEVTLLVCIVCVCVCVNV